MNLERKTPSLMATIQRECAIRQVFPGTVGGGDVAVCAIEPTP